MIRRSPTRIELKLDDIQEFDYVHYDKKKNPQSTETPAAVSAATAAKLLRHDRIGYHRSGTETNYARRTGALANPPNNTATPAADGALPTTTQPSLSSAAPGVTATSTPLPADPVPASTDSVTPVASTNLDPANLPSRIEASDSIYMDLADFNSTYASANMSMDET